MKALVLPAALAVSMLAGSAKADTLHCSDAYGRLTLEASSYSGGAHPFPGMLLREAKWTENGAVVGHVRSCYEGVGPGPFEDACAAFTPRPFDEQWSGRQTLSYTASANESREVFAGFVALHLVTAKPVGAYVICEEVRQFAVP